VGERRVLNWASRTCRRQDGDLTDQRAIGLPYQAAHIRVGQHLAQMLQLGFERRRGPARRRERRVVLKALDNAPGQWLSVGDGGPAKADRVIMRHVNQVSRRQPPQGRGTHVPSAKKQRPARQPE